MTALPPALRARQWAPGESGNPSGRGGLYHEVQRLAREASPGAVQRLIELAQLDRVDEEGKLLPLTLDADHRVVMMASATLIERGFGKPRNDYDPKADEPPKHEVQPRPLHAGAARANRSDITNDRRDPSRGGGRPLTTRSSARCRAHNRLRRRASARPDLCQPV